MNHPLDHRWTDLDVERYHDGDLPPDVADAFNRDLMSDPALRARLDAVRRLDDDARAALLAPAHPGQPTFRLRTTLAAAAAILLVAGAGFALWRLTPALPPAPVEEPIATETEEDAEADRANPAWDENGVVLVIDLSKRPEREQRWTGPNAPHTEPAASEGAVAALRPLEEALRSGDSVQVLRYLNESAPGDAGLERIGALLLSADTAREALLMLPPERRLDAVRVWARRPALRPVVFSSLQEMLANPATRSLAQDLRRELSEDPELRPWLASYASR